MKDAYQILLNAQGPGVNAAKGIELAKARKILAANQTSVTNDEFEAFLSVLESLSDPKFLSHKEF